MRTLSDFFVSDWPELLRLAIVGTLAYVGIVLLLRVTGKRALAKMSAYDLVVTIALGPCPATALLSSDARVDKVLLSFVLLLGLQSLAASLSTRWRWFHDLLNNEPTLVVHQGEMLNEAMRRHNLSEADIEAAVRSSGHGNVEHVAAVVMETDGSFSVIPRLDRDLASEFTAGFASAASARTCSTSPANARS